MRICSFLLATLMFCACGSPNNVAQQHAEENAIAMAYEEYNRGEEMRQNIKAMAEDKSQPKTQERCSKALAYLTKIDRSAADCISEMEQLKLSLLREIGVYLKYPETKHSVIARSYNSKYPLVIAYVELAKIKNEGSTDLIAYSSENGMRLRLLFEKYRKALTENLVASREAQQNLWYFKDPKIASFTNEKDLKKQLEKRKSLIGVHEEDLAELISVYTDPTLSDQTWKELLPETCNWVTAFGILTSLETTILKTRADVFTLIESRHYKSFSFTKILPIANGPLTVKAGTEVEFPVYMGAFDQGQNPVVTTSKGRVIDVNDGVATVRVSLAGKTEQLQGKIILKDRWGKPHTRSWNKTIVVSTKESRHEN